mgnify:CR=1 FL=1
MFSCAKSEHSNNQKFYIEKSNITSGEVLKINSFQDIDFNKNYTVKLIDSNQSVIETYFPKVYNRHFIVNRFLNQKIDSWKRYSVLIESEEDSQIIPLEIESSIIIESFCAEKNCNTLSGNIVENTSNKIKLKAFKIKPIKYIYTVITPYQTFEKNNNYNSPTSSDWLENIVLESVPEGVSFYIANIEIKAIDNEGNYAETSLPFKIVRPFEVKHFGKYELAEVYEPVPVTGCIPGSVGNNVQYSESESETRQNSVSITFNKSWSDSRSLTESISNSEGISVSETDSTVLSSSLSESETQSESFSDTTSEGNSSNISFNTTDGENWSWSLGETSSSTESQSQSEGDNTTINGSTTVGVSGEGSLPFLAKASGKVEVSAGVSRGWNSSNTNSSSETSSENRGYTTGGSSQEGRTFGSVQNDSRSHSLSGAYILSSSTSNSISESTSLSSGRVWNMSESLSSGKVITEGNSESIAQTIVTSNSSSTTFSYSGYIPRGRFGVFFRQTSRYVKLSEIISYSLNGFPQHAGFIIMNSWAWAPELSISNSCENAMNSNLPKAECLIQPCGE